MIRNKIVLVPFPYEDNPSEKKVRPAVCLTNTIGQKKQVVLAFITSQTVKELFDSDLPINEGDDDFNNTGLKTSSTIRLHKLITLSSATIARDLGVLPNKLHGTIKTKIKQLFHLDK